MNKLGRRNNNHVIGLTTHPALDLHRTLANTALSTERSMLVVMVQQSYHRQYYHSVVMLVMLVLLVGGVGNAICVLVGFLLVFVHSVRGLSD